MSNAPNTNLAIVEGSAPSLAPALLRPIASPATVIEAHKEAVALIEEALEHGRDYGAIPGTSDDKMVLLKPGAERLLSSFGLYVDTVILESEVDHDKINPYEQKKWKSAKDPGKEEKDRLKELGVGRNRKFDNGWVWQALEVEKGESRGLYRFVIRAEIRRRDNGAIVGTGIGACSSMESKYIRSPRDFENTILKMAKKRAMVDGTLNTLGLSDRFTQDVEDTIDAVEVAPAPVAHEPAPPSGNSDASKKAQTDWWTAQNGTPEQWAFLSGRGTKNHELVAEARAAGCTSVAEVLAYVQDGVVPGENAGPIDAEVVDDTVGKPSESSISPSSTDSAAAPSVTSPNKSPSASPEEATAEEPDPFGDDVGRNLALAPAEVRQLISLIRPSGLVKADILQLAEMEKARTFDDVMAIANREVALLKGAS